MLAARLVELGVATLHEAAGRRHLVRGVRLLVGEPFAGPAVTVGIPAGDNLGIHIALERAESGTVLCVVRAAEVRVRKETEARRQLSSGISSREVFGLPSTARASIPSDVSEHTVERSRHVAEIERLDE